MAPPKQSNTIDFDAAKQKRGPQPGGNASGPRASNLTELRQQLTLQLQSSLEAERILGLFFEEVRQLIPLDALGYRHPGSDLRLEFGSSAKHSVSYRLSHDSDYLGELIFRRRQRLGEDEQRQLESLLGTLLFPLRNALLYRAAIQTALRDALTGTGNRIAMDQALGRELELARRNLQPLSVLMLDIDHFKRVNDHYGHAVGDEALKAVAETTKDHLRNVDMVFRFGGEEFLVLLSSTPLQAACMVGERLRQAVEELDYRHAGEPLKLSISLGCADLRPGEGSDDLLRRVDEALYEAKRDGRNRLRCA
ncbi:GGDEF domain-containing protein [Pseudomonas aeruginosa]|nr:GGDEF domain-containing protein [Pseudomonas aeruginosa]